MENISDKEFTARIDDEYQAMLDKDVDPNAHKDLLLDYVPVENRFCVLRQYNRLRHPWADRS